MLQLWSQKNATAMADHLLQRVPNPKSWQLLSTQSLHKFRSTLLKFALFSWNSSSSLDILYESYLAEKNNLPASMFLYIPQWPITNKVISAIFHHLVTATASKPVSLMVWQRNLLELSLSATGGSRLALILTTANHRAICQPLHVASMHIQSEVYKKKNIYIYA